MTATDLDWVVALLAQRRTPLVEHAPVFWRPAPDAAAVHRTFLALLLSEGGARAYRTATSVLVASPRGDGWLVDDAHVPAGWHSADAGALWNAFAADAGGSPVRFVCPTYEPERAAFARQMGLDVDESWWLREMPSGGGSAGVRIELGDTQAVTVGAPPVYAPPGPILFLPDGGSSLALTAAITRAPELGCAAIVVNQSSSNGALADRVADLDFRRHCDFFGGVVRSTNADR